MTTGQINATSALLAEIVPHRFPGTQFYTYSDWRGIVVEWSDGPARADVLEIVRPYAREEFGNPTIVCMRMPGSNHRVAKPLLTLSCGHQRGRCPRADPNERHEVCSTPVTRNLGELQPCKVCKAKQIVMFEVMVALP